MANLKITSNLNQALAFAEKGWPVLPVCWPDAHGGCGCRKSRKHLGNDVGKATTTRHGFNDASTDGQVIQDWWGRDKPFNVAVNLGRANLLAIDLDSPEAEIEARGKGLPTTLVRASRQPAYIYRRPDGCPSTREAGKGSSRKINILSSGSLVFYGTNATGVPVYLENPDAEIAEAPQWAVDILIDSDSDKGEVEPVKLPDILPDTSDLKLPAELRRLISESGLPDRSKHCFRVAASLVKYGHPDEIIAAILLDRRNAISEKPRE